MNTITLKQTKGFNLFTPVDRQSEELIRGLGKHLMYFDVKTVTWLSKYFKVEIAC